jgi:hypothetical protein
MTQYDPVTDYLMHYGRKGMKWHKHIFGNDKRFASKEYPDAQAYLTNSKRSISGHYGPQRTQLHVGPYGQTYQSSLYANGNDKFTMRQKGLLFDTVGTVKNNAKTRKTSVSAGFQLNKRGKAVLSASRAVAVSAVIGGGNIINRGRERAAKFINKKLNQAPEFKNTIYPGYRIR